MLDLGPVHTKVSSCFMCLSASYCVHYSTSFCF